MCSVRMSSTCAWSGARVQAEHQCLPRSSGKSRIQLLVTSTSVITGCFCLCDSETREGLPGISESTNSSHENGSDKKILSHLSYTPGRGFSAPIPPDQEVQDPQALLLLLGALCGGTSPANIKMGSWQEFAFHPTFCPGS